MVATDVNEMKVLSIRRLVERYPIPQLQEAEHDIIYERPLKIEIDTKMDASAKLSTVIAAVWILEDMQIRKVEFKEAFCAYTEKVRDY